MRDFIPHDTPAMLADLTRHDAGPGKPVDGDPADPVARVPPENGNGHGRGWESVRTRLAYLDKHDHVTVSAVGMIYDTALAIVRAAPPMPLESPDPWREDDDAYRRRLDGAEQVGMEG